MLFVPREKAREGYAKVLRERQECRKKEREKYFEELYKHD